nr:putative ribonuclease H-like domain-containing protein [Tanacetum cinerariifolium]
MCKKSITKSTYFGYLDPFIKNTIEPNFSPEIEKVLKGLNEFQRCLKEEMVADLRYFNSLESEVDSLRSQLETQKTQFSNEIDRLSREYYYANHMNAILGLYTELDEVTNLQCIVISELKKLIEKLKGKSVDTKFEKSLVIRQPNAFKSQRPSVLGKPTTFSNSFIRKDFSKSTSVTQNNVSNDFSKPVTTQTFPTHKKSCLKNTNLLAPGMYKLHTYHTQDRTSKLPQDYKKTNKRVSFSTGVIPTTSVSRPQLKNSPHRDRVLCNNSRGKKLEVEEHRRNVKLSKNKTSVTACNDSLNAKTLNVKSVFAICAKCAMIKKHDVCVLNSVAKPLKKTVASESNKKPRNNERSNLGMTKLHLFLDMEIWFKDLKSTCFIRDLKGNDLLTGSRSTDLYSITLQDLNSPNPICLMAKATSSQKFLGTIKFGNDQIAPILGYGDLVQGAVTIKRVYYVKGLNHNLFSVGQFCDANLEVAFRKSTCFIRDLKGNDLLTGSRGTDLYLITLQSSNSPNLICLMDKATSSQAWLWHRRLSHLNFDTINLLSKNDIVVGLPKLNFVKDHLCSSCELGKAKRKSFHTKYTWTHFLRSKVETPEVLIDFLRLVQRGLHAQVRVVRTDKGTEFLNQTLHAYFAAEGIQHQTSVARTPEQNGVVERRNHTLSTSGGIQFLGGDKLVSWSSKKHDCTSMSSAEAEYVSLSACYAQVLWMRTQLTDYGFHFDKIQKVKKGIVELFFVGTEYQLADLFTEALPVERSKKDKRGIVVRNKARLVAQGHTQEEGINYEEVFAPVARIEAIRLLLDCASFMGFMVYQMDVKSAFLYGTIKEEVYVYQPLGFEDPNYPDKIYKVVKRGKIDQTLFIKRQTCDIQLVQIYVDDIIFGYTNKDLRKAFEKLMKDKFQMSSMGELTFFLDRKSDSTPIDTEKPLLKDPDGEDVDVHTYRSMIDSLMYLTLSRRDIMFVVCACAHF